MVVNDLQLFWRQCKFYGCHFLGVEVRREAIISLQSLNSSLRSDVGMLRTSCISLNSSISDCMSSWCGLVAGLVLLHIIDTAQGWVNGVSKRSAKVISLARSSMETGNSNVSIVCCVFVTL